MLANWFFFWDGNEWHRVGADPQPDAERFSKGSGKKRKYEPLGDDYWTLREAQLKGLERDAEEEPQQEENDGPNPDTLAADAAAQQITQQLSEMEAQLAQATMAVSLAVDPAQKAQIASQAMQLSIDISKLRSQYYERASALRMLDVF